MTFPNLSDPYLGLDPFFFALILIWSMAWKALALWKSARKNQPIWFVALFVVNLVGILEILYLFFFSEMQPTKKSKKAKRKK